MPLLRVAPPERLTAHSTQLKVPFVTIIHVSIDIVFADKGYGADRTRMSALAPSGHLSWWSGFSVSWMRTRRRRGRFVVVRVLVIVICSTNT
jgi:hypothetical protein